MTALRTLVIPFLILTTASLALVIGINMSRMSAIFAFLPLALFLGLAAAWLVISAVRGQRWALAAFIFVSIIVMATDFRDREVRGEIDFVSYMKFSFFFVAFVIGFFALVRTYRSFLQPPGIFMILYGSWAAITAFVSPTPIFTLGAVFALFAWMLVAVTISEHFSEREILLVLLMSLAVYVVISWFLYLAFPELGIQYSFYGAERFTGLAGSPNQGGQIAALYLVVLFAYCVGGYGFAGKYAPYVKALVAFVAVLSAGMLALSISRGAMLALLCVPPAIFLQRKKSIPVALLAVATIVLAIAYIPDPIQLVEEYLVGISRSGSLKEIVTLTGRTHLWAFLVDRIMEAPIMGVGYAAARATIPVEYILPYGKVQSSTHNFVLQSLYEIGVIGTVFFLLIVIHQIVKFFREPSIFRDSILVFVLVTGIVEAGIAASTGFIVFFWFLSIFVGEAERRRAAGKMSSRAIASTSR